MSSGEINKKSSKVVIDSRFLKIVAAKKAELQDALIFVCLNETKYGHLDKGRLKKIVETLERVAPESVWFGATKDYSISIIDRNLLKNKDLLVTIRYEDESMVDRDSIEQMIKSAIPEAKSTSFVHTQNSVDVGTW